ncbi:ribosomal protein S5 domain 2-like protein [Schizopora paradoxa]|uniref:Ribosomal protein S5 domain 2-like protein n=1 Tax=Schizopora paradoxa TaxID=27342 RepID=A0A0H2S4C4_9AGAM|nr:ribosomal protein S5 domain 2-like protein [Schizopora paradoxa]
MAGTLDGYVTSSKSPPICVATSQTITDRESTFVGSIYKAASIAQAQEAIRYHTEVVNGRNKASHEIAAWRCMVLKPGRTGLQGADDDFEVKSGAQDDGENHGGRTVLMALTKEAVLDAVVIVSRWYGGVMLGPVRFTHIEICAREVARNFREIEEIETCIEELNELDEELLRLRALLPQNAGTDSSANPTSPTKPRDYRAMLLGTRDVEKAKRLVRARQNAVKSVQSILATSNSDADKTS